MGEKIACAWLTRMTTPMSQLTVLSDEIVDKHKNPCSSSPRAWMLMYASSSTTVFLDVQLSPVPMLSGVLEMAGRSCDL